METSRAIAAFLAHNRAKRLSPKTVESYRWALGYLAELPALPEEPEDLELVLAEAGEKLADESLFDLWRRWRAFFRWTTRRLRLANPMERVDPWSGQLELLVDRPRRVELLPRGLHRDQVFQLLDRGCRRRRDRLMVLVPLDTGLRLSEIAGLTKDNLSPDGVRVLGKGRRERVVPITLELVTELLVLGDHNHPWVDAGGHPLTWEGVKTAYRRIFARAGILAGPHSLRHTFATTYLRRGGSIWALQRILGHRDVRTTERYLHLVSDDLVRDHREVSPAREWLAPMRRLL